MANPEHLAILKQGVAVWNEWREKNLEIRPDLSWAKLEGLNLEGVNLRDSFLLEANLAGAKLIEATLVSAGLYRVNLNKADLSGAHLAGANFTPARQGTGGEYGAANLSEANFHKADISEADLSLSNLRDTNLRGANLSWVNLSRAFLLNTDFSHAIARGTMFVDVDMSSAKGVDLIWHGGPSTIGIDTIYRSGGNIPEAFLRGCGVPETFITYARSLVGQPIQFYSCFISYSSKDQAFAERLHADLQSKGVRVWFAPEDLKIGDKFRSRIDEAIRIYDKLLIVLSKNSIESAWVEKEVETAFEKENQQKRTMLFPIRLDNAVMETNHAWAADIRRTRQIGDFSNWKEHDCYQVAFNRLLRDLKADDTMESKL